MAEIHRQQQIKAFRNSWGGVATGRGLSSSLSRWLVQLCDGGGGGSASRDSDSGNEWTHSEHGRE